MEPLPHTFVCNISSRGRLRLTGKDRMRFLNAQATNDVKNLPVGFGCYAAFTNAKGKMRSDAVILNRGDSLIVDLEPGYDVRIAADLEKFIIADDVQLENISATWRAYTLIGMEAPKVLTNGHFCSEPPGNSFEMSALVPADFSKGFLFRSRRARCDSFDFWVEQSHDNLLQIRLAETIKQTGGTFLDATALEILRVEAGIPRFGVDMDDSAFPQEAGIEAIAISYTKGCYVGQEVIARIKSVGHVNRTLVRLRLPEQAKQGDPLFLNHKETGKVGSAVSSPTYGRIGLAIVRREASAPGTVLTLPNGNATVVAEFKSMA